MNENHEKLLSLANVLTEENLSYRRSIPGIGCKTIIQAVAGEIYAMHPHGTPEGVPEICSSILEALRNIEQNYPGTKYRKTDRGHEMLRNLDTTVLYTFLIQELNKIPEFTRLANPTIEEDVINLNNCIWIIYLDILEKSMINITWVIRDMIYGKPQQRKSSTKEDLS